MQKPKNWQLVNPYGKINLQRLRFFSRYCQSHNNYFFQRISKASCEIMEMKLSCETLGSYTFRITNCLNGNSYETVLGKQCLRGFCACDDFQRSIELAERYGNDVLPCKHLIKAMCYIRSEKVITFLKDYLFPAA